MNQESAVDFEGVSRIHIALEVADLERSLAFYRILFGEGPVKVRTGYARFEPRHPRVNLSLNEGSGEHGPRPGAWHLGIQVQSSDAVRRMEVQLREADLPVRVEKYTACCYSIQNKVWVADPDGNPWEVFVVVAAESPARFATSSSCCTATAVASGPGDGGGGGSE